MFKKILVDELHFFKSYKQKAKEKRRLTNQKSIAKSK
tara:strand:+ start:620 stop:730 length:111 start_codon:yes stop_codon:yes gene_type:complete